MREKFGPNSAEFLEYREQGIRGRDENNDFCTVESNLYKILKRESFFQTVQKKWIELFEKKLEIENDPRIFLFYVNFQDKNIVEKLHECDFLDDETYQILCDALDEKTPSHLKENTLKTESKLSVDLFFEEDTVSPRENYAKEKISKVSKELLIQMTENYQDFIEKRREELKEKIEKQKEPVLQLIRKRLQQFGIVLDEKIEKRVSEIEVTILDPFVAKLEEVWGQYRYKSDKIFLRADLSDENLFSVLVHEYLHALSSSSITFAEKNYSDDEEEEEDDWLDESKYTSDIYRIGFGFYGIDGGQDGAFLRWLNESVVEYFSKEACEKKKHGYVNEISVYEMLLKKVPESIFLKALFEEYDRTISSKERLVHLRTLIQEINKAFGPFFFQKLNKYIQKNGIDVAAQKARKGELEKEIQST